MITISMVVAAAEDNAIGKNNDLLWKLPNDLKFLKNITWGMPVLMGRITYDSLKGYSMPGRKILVLSRQPNLTLPHATVFAVFNDAVAWCEQHGYKDLLVLGGGNVYETYLPLTHNIYLTRVHASFPDADAHFPPIPTNEFSLVKATKHDADAKHAYAYTFEHWQRNIA